MPELPLSSAQTKSIKGSAAAQKGQNRSVHCPGTAREPENYRKLGAYGPQRSPNGRGKWLPRVSVSWPLTHQLGAESGFRLSP